MTLSLAKVRCPSCGKRLSLPEGTPTKKLRCGACLHDFEISEAVHSPTVPEPTATTAALPRRPDRVRTTPSLEPIADPSAPRTDQLGQQAAQLKRRLDDLQRQFDEASAEAQKLGYDSRDLGFTAAQTLRFESAFEAQAREKFAQRQAELDRRQTELTALAAELERKTVAADERARQAAELVNVQLESAHRATRQLEQRLEAQRGELEEMSARLTLRRDRLRRYRAALQRRAAPTPTRPAPLPAPVAAKPRTIYRATFLAVCVTLTLVVLAAGSHRLATALAQPVWRITCAVEPPVSGPVDATAWLDVQRQALLADDLLAAALRAIDAHGKRVYRDVPALRAALEADLVLGSHTPGRLDLRLDHPDRMAGVFLLDALGKALAGREGVRRLAAYDPVPVSDPTMTLAVLLFLAGVILITGVTALVTLILHRRSRA